MPTRIDIVFGSKVDDSGAKHDIKEIQNMFSSKAFVFKPDIDEKALNQLKKNIRVTIDEATKLKTITTKFTQNRTTYSLTQKETAPNEYSPVDIKETRRNIDDLISKLKKLYSTALDLQSSINQATGSDSMGVLRNSKRQLEETEAQIKSLSYAIQSLGHDLSKIDGISRSQERLDIKKDEKTIIADAKAAREYAELMSRLEKAYRAYDKAVASGQSEESIKAVLVWVKMLEEETKRVVSSTSSLGDKYKEFLKERYAQERSLQESIDSNKQIEKFNTLFSELKKAYSDFERAMKSGESAEIIDKITDKIIELSEKTQRAARNNQTLVDTYNEFVEMQSRKESDLGASYSDALGEKGLKDLIKDLRKYSDLQREIILIEKKSGGNIESLSMAQQEYYRELQRVSKELQEEIELHAAMTKGTHSEKDAIELLKDSYNELELFLKKVNARASESITFLQKVSISIKDSISNFFKYQVVDNIFDIFVQKINEAVDSIYELNKAMTDIQVVTSSTTEEVSKLAEQYSKMAQELGATTTEVASGASEWLRQGKSQEETNQLLTASMKLSKVGAVESSQATTYLTAVMNGFQMEASEAMRVVDALSNVDLEAATSVNELAEALQNTSNIARVNGVEFEELIGMVGAVSEATRRSASVVGNSFKTIFSRMTNVAAGKNTDDEGESLNDVETSLKKNNIELRKSTGEWRDMMDVISEVASKWDKFNDVQRDQISTAMAGTRQREIFLSLMENWDRVQHLIEAAYNSEGVADEKFGIYLDSLEAKTKSLQASFEDLLYSDAVVNGMSTLLDLAKGLVDTFNDLANNSLAKLAVVEVLVVKNTKHIIDYLGYFQKGADLSKASDWTKSLVASWASLRGKIEEVKESFEMAQKAGLSNIQIMKTALSTLFTGVSAALAPAIAIGTVFTGIAVGIDLATKTVDEYNAEIEKTNQKMSDLQSKIEEISGKPMEDRTQAEQEYLAILEAELENLKKQGELLSLNRDKYEQQTKEIIHNQYSPGVPNFLSTLTNPEEVLRGDLEKLQTYNNAISNASSNGYTLEQVESLQGKVQQIESTWRQVALNIIEAEEAASENGYQLDETNQRLKEMLEDSGLWDEFVSEGNQILSQQGDILEENSDVLEEEVSVAQKLVDTFTQLSDAQELIESINSEVEESGQISLDNLNSLLETYPSLTDAVTNYLLGLSSTTDVLNAIQEAYTVDKNNLYQSLVDKLKTQQNYYQLVSQLDSALMEQFATEYDIDTGTHATYASAKEAVEKELFRRVSNIWSNYYDTQLTSVEQLARTVGNDFDLPASDRKYIAQQIEAYKNAMKALDDIYDQTLIKGFEDSYQKIASASKEIENSANSASDAVSEQEKAYQDLLDMTIKMLKKKKELEKEALKEQLDGYKKVIDAQKELLDLQKEEYDHKNEVEEKNKNISTLEKQIAELQFDVSAEGTKKRLELEEELAEAKKELEDYQYKYSIDKQKDALDKEEERYEEYINNQIDEIDRYLDQTGLITQEAINLINQRSQELFNDLIEYNRLYGDSLDQTVINAWNGAVGAVNNYTSSVNSAISATRELASAASSISNMPVQRKPNTSSVNKRPTAGSGMNHPYYQVKHKGIDSGFVGNVKGNEQFVKALKGEAFITKPQQDNFMKNVLPSMLNTARESTSNTFGNLLNINVSGNLDSTIVPQIEKIAQNLFNKLNKTMFQGGYVRNTSTVPF